MSGNQSEEVIQLRKDLKEHERLSRWPDIPYGWECECPRCEYIRMRLREYAATEAAAEGRKA